MTEVDKLIWFYNKYLMNYSSHIEKITASCKLLSGVETKPEDVFVEKEMDNGKFRFLNESGKVMMHGLYDIIGVYDTQDEILRVGDRAKKTPEEYVTIGICGYSEMYDVIEHVRAENLIYFLGLREIEYSSPDLFTVPTADSTTPECGELPCYPDNNDSNDNCAKQ